VKRNSSNRAKRWPTFYEEKNQQLIIDAQNPSECRTQDFLKKRRKAIMLPPYRVKLAQTGIYFF
jgi:hypothetical protein